MIGQQLEHQQRPAFELELAIAKARLTAKRVDVQPPSHHWSRP